MKETGLVDKNGNAVGRSYFFRTIRNPLYKGVIKQFGRTVKGTFNPIVPEQLFDNVQNILKGRMNDVKHYLKENPDFPLRRFVVDDNGRPITGYWSKGKKSKYPYYSFYSKGTTIRKETLELKFMELLQSYAFDNFHLNALKEYLGKHFGKKSSNEIYANNAMEKRIEQINQEIDQLIQIHGQGNISVNIFSTRIKKLEDEMEELQELLKVKKSENINIPDLLDFAVSALKGLHHLWEKCPLEIKRKLQVFGFSNVIIFDGVNFRTPKICSVFKLKVLIDDLKFPRVNLRVETSNTSKTEVLPPYPINLLETKAFWEEVAAELNQLKVILE
jgi:site-specific DNA recombinase